MNVKRFVCCLLASVLLLGVSLISCGNSSRAKAKNEIAQSGEDFKSFLDKFTSSAAFQYTRIKFPLKTPITLLADDGETEKTFPFTKEKWPLLDSETMKEERIEQEEGGIYVSKFGLKKTLFTLCCIFNLPFVAYTFLAVAQPTNVYLIGTCITMEYFGYGFGFVGLTLFMMQQIAPGKHQMSHYAFASGIMNLGVMLPGMVSGYLSDLLGYRNFFIYVLIATIPAFLITYFIPFTYDDSKK